MERSQLTAAAAAHAEAVVRGDTEAITNDLVPELQPRLPELAKFLPDPTTEADVVEVSMQGDHAIVVFRYAGGGESVGFRSRWELRDGRPQVVDAEPIDG